ncbi:MAG: amino acid ABC transporter substrate-binding protein [Halomonadaceae bacterium]|nr:MAG: amino acid ABC transporter substrate-binding protein [Halomonadaceae bacterium]
MADPGPHPVPVYVGGYDFPPFVTASAPPAGATIDLIESLNGLQDQYQFHFQKITANRRYLDFSAHRYDLILFEQPQWGWEGLEFHQTGVIAEDDEVYVALRREGRDQEFFTALETRRLIGYLGYHYGFAGMESDVALLQQNFDITLTRNHRRNLQLILLDRPDVAEVAIVTRSFLESEMTQYPQQREQLLISERLDQRYRLRGLLHPQSTLSAETLDKLLMQLEDRGELARLRQFYGLAPPG